MDATAIEDLFRPVGPVRLKRMFGGYGIYRRDAMIALEFDGMVWLKADAQSRDLFEQAGSRAFTYEKKAGGVTVMSFWLLPEICHDDDDAMKHWVDLAQEAAQRAAAPKPTRQAKSRRKP